jgi:thioredoxin-related protein
LAAEIFGLRMPLKLTIRSGIFILPDCGNVSGLDIYNIRVQSIRTGAAFMRLKYFWRIRFVTLCLVLCFSGAVYASDAINWYAYEEGKVLAKVEKKKVFLHFYANWCGFCLKMAKETFQNAAVLSDLNKNFIAIRVDFDKEPETVNKYGVMGLPSSWFLTAMGQPIISIPGYISPEAMLSMLKQVKEVGESG